MPGADQPAPIPRAPARARDGGSPPSGRPCASSSRDWLYPTVRLWRPRASERLPRLSGMRLIVARCSVEYSGRLSAHLPEALRLIMLKADGIGARARRRGRVQAAELDDPTDRGDRGARHDHRAQDQGRRPAGDHAARGGLRRHAHDGLRRRPPVQGGRGGRSAGRAGRRAALLRRGLPARAPRVADRHRPGGPDVPRRGRAGSRSRSSASARSTRSSSSRATSSASGWTRRWPSAAASSPRRWSSRRRACSARPAASTWVEVDLAELRGEREPALTLFGLSRRGYSPLRVRISERPPPWSRCSQR